MVTAVNNAGSGHVFVTGICTSTAPLRFTVPFRLSGIGPGSNDFSQTPSVLAFSSPTEDEIDSTSEYAQADNLLILNTSGGPTGGIAFNFCSSDGASDAFLAPTFEIENVNFGYSYIALNSCNAEVLKIQNSKFIGIYETGVQLASTTFNNGDCVIDHNMFTASANEGFAAIDFEGATNCRISSNKDVLGFPNPTGTFDYFLYNGSANPSTGMLIYGNDLENFWIMAMQLGSDCSGDAISINGIVQNYTAGPAIECTGTGQNFSSVMNAGLNATGSTIAEFMYFPSGLFNSTIMPQTVDGPYSGGGYTVVQSGMIDGLYGNHDYTTLLTPFGLLSASLTLNGINTLGYYSSGSDPTILKLRNYIDSDATFESCDYSDSQCGFFDYDYAGAGTYSSASGSAGYGIDIYSNVVGRDSIWFRNAAKNVVAGLTDVTPSHAFDTTHTLLFGGGGFGFWDGTYKGLWALPSFTGNRNWQMPDASGLVALTPGVQASGYITLSSGTVTISTPAACSPSTTCIYKIANCGTNSSVALGVLTIGTVTGGTSFVINSKSATAALVTTDNSIVCWQIN